MTGEKAMEGPLFSIIVVTLNPGEKLLSTMESIRSQTCTDYQVVVKDGGSKDGSLESLKELRDKEYSQGDEKDVSFWDRVEIYEKSDKSIYEGMNQAAELAVGRFYYFLNCGDYFYDSAVLEQVKQEVFRQDADVPMILYGDIHDALRNVRVPSNPSIDGFGCYRNVPCHQACIYDAGLFAERGYETKYRVRGDYEHFLWSFYVKKAKTVYVPVIVASYEGGGFSETKENRKRSAAEHKEITSKYMSKGELFRYRAVLFLTLAPLRTKMAESPRMSGFYNRVKNLLYGRRS
jgi:glycosyltransferase involved in cell wall biosynthesis